MDGAFEFAFVIHSNGVEHSLKAMGDGLKNLKPAFKKFGDYLMDKLQKRLAAQGDGTWPDYADSTKKRMEATRTGIMTKFGKVRVAHLRKLVSYEKFLKGKAKREEIQHGDVSEKTFDKLINLENKIQKLRQQKETQKKSKQHKARKRTLNTSNMLGKLKRLKFRMSSEGLRIGLLDGPDWAFRHNEGDSPIPKRQIVPEGLDAEDIEKFKNIMQEHFVYVSESSPSEENQDLK